MLKVYNTTGTALGFMGLKSRIKRLEEENQRLGEENQKLKEDNRKLRLAIYGIKPSKKNSDKDIGEGSKSEPKKRGPPEGHEGTSRKRPEKADRTEEGAENRDVTMRVQGTMKLQGKDFLNDGKEHVLNTLT